MESQKGQATDWAILDPISLTPKKFSVVSDLDSCAYWSLSLQGPLSSLLSVPWSVFDGSGADKHPGLSI